MTNWKKLIDLYIRDCGDDDTIIACTLTNEELEQEFDNGFGVSCGKSFTAWSERYVYFPVVYDGAEWVARAPRNICDEATRHVGRH